MRQRIDSLAQQVEHNTFNVGVLGSSPRRITRKSDYLQKIVAFFIVKSFVVDKNKRRHQINDVSFYFVFFREY